MIMINGARPFPFAIPPLVPQSPMSNKTQGKSQNLNWGGARQGAGRPKKTLKRTFTQLQDADSDSQPPPILSGSGGTTHSSFEPATGHSNLMQHSAKKLPSKVTGFFWFTSITATKFHWTCQ
jgi:hypothetical protein